MTNLMTTLLKLTQIKLCSPHPYAIRILHITSPHKNLSEKNLIIKKHFALVKI